MTKCTRFYVYLHLFKNGSMYVGKGARDRYRQTHESRRSTIWNRTRDKHGSPVCRIIESGLSESEAYDIEKYVMRKLQAKGKRLCNMLDGGGPNTSLIFTPERRAAISKHMRENGSPMSGRKHSQEMKQKMSELKTGKNLGSEHPRYKNEIYTIIEEATGIVIIGTKKEIEGLPRMSQPKASMLCSGKITWSSGYRMFNRPYMDVGRRGKRHGKHDKTIFRFMHKEGKVEVCTKYDLNQKYRFKSPSNLTNLCKGKIPSFMGWTVDLTS